MANTLNTIMKVEQCNPAIGAEISGVQISEAIHNDDLFHEIKALWLQHKVLFFREQEMSLQQHRDFALRFGTLEDHPVAPSHPDFPGLVLIQRQKERSTYENVWHADATWRQVPPKGAILRCEVVPEIGGDTMWANMAMAYDRLPDRVKERITDLWAIHSIEQSFGGNMTPEGRAQLVTDYPPARHPVVVTHPETGLKVLYVNQGFTTNFVNFARFDRIRVGADYTFESNNLMNYLLHQVEIPEYQVRLRWRPGTIAMWDNRSTQHYAIHDYWPAQRNMCRAAIEGTETPTQ